MFAVLAFAITGLVAPAMSSAFADTDNNGRDKGTKTAKGCDNGTAKNNPNCNDGGSGTTDPFTICDNNPVDGKISDVELAAALDISLADAQNDISTVESAAGSKGQDKNGAIDTLAELEALTALLLPAGIPNPCAL